MKRSPMPPRKKALTSSTPLNPGSGLRRTSIQAQRAGRESLSARGTGKSAPRRESVPVGPSNEVRDAVIERERHSCLICGYGVGPDERGRRWSLHHRLRRAQGPDHSIQNLILLCGGSEADGCHQRVHRDVDDARAGGWLLKGRMEPLAKKLFIPLEDRWVYLTSVGTYHDVKEVA